MLNRMDAGTDVDAITVVIVLVDDNVREILIQSNIAHPISKEYYNNGNLVVLCMFGPI